MSHGPRAIAICLAVALGGAAAHPAFGASSVVLEEDFEVAPDPMWTSHFVSSPGTYPHLPMPDPTLDWSGTMSPTITSAFGGGFDSTSYMLLTTPTAPNGECTLTGGCDLSCSQGTSQWGMVDDYSYDPAVEGEVESIDVTVRAKTWHTAPGSRYHQIQQGVGVLFRQELPGGGYRYFRTSTAPYVSWFIGDPATPPAGDEYWTEFNFTILPTDTFMEWDPPDEPFALVGVDFSLPFQLGISFARTATHAGHLCDNGFHAHGLVYDMSVGMDEFFAEIHAVDSDDDGIPDNLDLPCDNGADDDDDGDIDLADDGCFTAAWPTENPECSDGVDNDGHGDIDYPADAGCGGPSSRKEEPECQDGVDNDGDTYVDDADPECSGGFSNPKEGTGCGLLGLEVLPVLAWAALAGRGCERRRRA